MTIDSNIIDLNPRLPFKGTVKCSSCPFGRQKVGSRGWIGSKVVIVGESPGIVELRLGKPFTGPSGDVLWDACPHGETDDVYVTNAMQCSPGKKKDPASLSQAVKSCHERLIEEIQAYPRDIIITLGNPAIWSLTNNHGHKITQIRGRLIPSPLSKYGILPAVHPAAILRGTGSYRQFKEDIAYAFEVVESGRSSIRSPVPITSTTVPDTPDKVENVVAYLRRMEYVAADNETDGFNPRQDELLCTGLCGRAGETFIVPSEFTPLLAPLAKPGGPKLIWHNGKFDIKFNRREGVNFKVDEDTMLQSYTLDEVPGIHDLEQVASDVIGAPDYKNMLKPYLKDKTRGYSQIPKPVLYQYNALDLSNTREIFDVYRSRIRADPALEKLYTRTLLPMSELLTRVESKGIYVDQEHLEKVGDQYVGNFQHYLTTGKVKAGKLKGGEVTGGELHEATKAFHEAAGYPLNPNSPVQVAELFFDRLKLPTTHGRSTDKEVLAKLPNHPCVVALRTIRTVAKAFSTYVVGVYLKVEDDSRVYTTFMIHGTRTGRLSSRKPNVQNVPRLALIRNIYACAPGRILIEIDLNQAELRSLAALSGDTYLCALFNDNTRNLHDEMSEFLFPGWGVRAKSKDEVLKVLAKEERMRSKAVNFGIPYGREAGTIAEEFNVRNMVAQEWIDGWFKRAPGAHDFILRCRRAARNGSTITTAFGNKKRHWIVTRENVKALMNEASNFPHQAIASHINSHGAMAVTLEDYESPAEHLLQEYDAFVVNLVHDSMLIDAPDDKATVKHIAEFVGRKVQEIPREWGIKRVPFLTDAKVGYSWGNLKPLEEFYGQ